MQRLLLVDDEPHVLNALERSLRRAFRDEDIRIETRSDPREALERVGELAFDVVMSDYRMPGMTGVALLRQVRTLQPDAMRIILSASTDFNVVMSAINDAETFRFIAKPWDDAELVGTIRLALARRAELLEERRLADELRVRRGELTPQEREARRLEELEPGLTDVKWGPDGSVLLVGS